MNKVVLLLGSDVEKDKLVEAFEKELHAEVLVPYVSPCPQYAMPILEKYCRKEKPTLVIGWGLGAMYAIKLCGFKRLCINPHSLNTPLELMNAHTLPEFDMHLYDDLGHNDSCKCWGFFTDDFANSWFRKPFAHHFYPNIIDIPRCGRSDSTILSQVIVPFANMLLDGEYTDEWGVTYTSYGRELKDVDISKFTCEKYVMPNDVEEIESFGFHGCKTLKKVILSPTVTIIPACTFEGCTNLELVLLPDQTKYISNNAFSYCESLKHITLPPNIRELMVEVFSCSGLESIDIHENITDICYRAFWGCKHLKSLVIPLTVDEISAGIVTAHKGFEGVICQKPGYHVENEALIKDDTGEMLCCWTTQKDYVVPSCVKLIGDISCNEFIETITVNQPVELTSCRCMSDNPNLREVNFRSSVRGITDETFDNCPNLLAIPENS